MAPLDPSLLFAAGVLLDLVYEILPSEYTKTEATGFWVEWLAWAILLSFYWVRPIVHHFAAASTFRAGLEEAALSEKRPQSKYNVCITIGLSVCLVAFGFLSRSGHETHNWTLPMTTMLVLLLLLALRLDPDQNDSWHSSLNPLGCVSPVSATAFIVASLVSAGLIRFHSSPEPSWISAFDISLLLLQCIIYSALVRVKLVMLSEDRPAFRVQELLLQRFSTSSFALWTLLLVVSRAQNPRPQPALFILGIMRAIHYFVLLTLCLCYSRSTIICSTTLPTVAIAVSQCLRAPSSSASLAGALVALAALCQSLLCLPSSASHRKLPLFIVLIPCVANIYRHTYFSSWGSRLSETFAKPDLHPIDRLAANGQSQFSHLLTSQSTTLRDAVVEYIRRYKRRPPPNFDKWFGLAEREECVLFDEFDTMMETLEPYWGIPPWELRSRVDAAFEDPRLIRFNISDATVSFDHEGWAPWIAAQVESWLPPEWLLLLPNMTFAVNILDEPRVVAPFDAVSGALRQERAKKSLEEMTDKVEDWTRRDRDVDILKVDRLKAWEAMAPACSSESPARTNSSLGAEHHMVQFIANTTDSLDICMHTSLHKTHGFLSSPDSLEITHTLVPLFSQGKPSIFNDVLIPSPYYAGKMDQQEYVEADDPDWEEKSDILYWSGATTGGYATMENWQSLHRQHLMLSLKSQPSNLVTLLNETSPGRWKPHTVPMSELESLFQLKMIGTAQCEPEVCEVQRHAFNIAPFGGEEENPNKDPLNLTYQARYALDIDGNGFSGRYYRLLKSRSAVIKQTIFKEWHDGHLVPWVHYIPLSMEAAELPETMRFLTKDPRGREIGRKIAQESRSWANITLRKIDLQLAFLRLLMEYGRLMSDDRDTLNYGP